MDTIKIGQRIAERRNELGFTVDYVASEIGVAKSTISRYENGSITKIKLPIIEVIARVLSVNPNWIACKTDNKFLTQEQEQYEKASRSPEIDQLVNDYKSLDVYGKQAVREVVRVEKARCEDELRFLRETQAPWEKEPRIINLFLDGSAAGPLSGITGQEYEPYELQPDDPQGAAYAVKVSGDSMEPYFPDGSIVFADHEQLRDGDIGIFCVDGKNLIKQYHFDPVLGITYLFSLNRKRDDMDQVFTRSDPRSIVCQGRVLTPHRFPIPGIG